MSNIFDVIQQLWPFFIAGAGFVIPLLASSHAILYKRDSRSVIAWVGLIWLVPFLGTILYILLGINRIRRRVSGQRGHESKHYRLLKDLTVSVAEMESKLPQGAENLVEMMKLCDTVTNLPLLKGNDFQALFNGDEAYPEMLDAIQQAKISITFLVYIFDNDDIGRRFIQALAAAVERGVEVRVLVDAVGVRYSRIPVTKDLNRLGVKSALFMSGRIPWKTQYVNLRNHRKIMVVDGVYAFSGGMNIRDRHIIQKEKKHPTLDIHFAIRGPVVQQIQAAFVEDWFFTTQELLEGSLWFPSELKNEGSDFARIIPDGPDQNLDRMSMAFSGALASAQHSVCIMTPYFLPDRALISALNICALRGVSVDILLPKHNNLKMVAWASMAQMWQVLEWGCRVWLTGPEFDHSKIMVVDHTLNIVGSSNWDPRSLRLNFELGLECYSTELAGKLEELIHKRMNTAELLTLEKVDSRSIPLKLRDGLFRLAAPYL